MNAKIKTTHAVYVNEDDTCGNPFRLTPYVSQDGEIWLASEGNGCGDDVMLEDIGGWTNAEICERWEDIDLDALRVDADEIRAAGDADSADWIDDWCRTCERARTGFVSPEMIGDEATEEDAEAVAEYLNDHGYNVRVASGDNVGDGVSVPERTWKATVEDIRGRLVEARRVKAAGISGGSFGERVASARMQIGMKQRTLAVQSGLTAASLCQIEHGNRSPSVDVACRIADALGVSVDALCGRPSNRKRKGSTT